MLKNHHLNIFRFFNEGFNEEFSENNLSRALSITLNNCGLFFNEFIKSITSPEDYQYFFTSISNDSSFSINLQVDIDSIKNENFKTVYAIALTSNKSIDMNDFFVQNKKEGKNITDVLITIKDVAFVIEVKKTGEDCKNQLFNQVTTFIDSKEKIKVIPKSYTWQEVIKLMEIVKNINKLTTSDSVFINDFLQLSEFRYPEWFDPKPFYVLKFSSQRGTPTHFHLNQRLRQALTKVINYELINSNDRLSLEVPFGWANELIPTFELGHDNKEYLVFNVWPGNTKTQGWQIFNKPLDWINKESLFIDENEYELQISYHIKLCHFNKYISSINFSKEDIMNPIYSFDNFQNKSGKWEDKDWDELESFLDDNLKKEYNWREQCNWDGNFKNSERTYLTVSFGFEVSVFIPYSEISQIDQKEEDVINVSNKINKVIDSLKKLI